MELKLKKSYSLSFLFLFLGILAFAQEAEYSKKYLRLKDDKRYQEGYVVENNGDTIRGILRLKYNPSYEISSFWFITKEGKRIYYEPLEVQVFSMGENKYLSNEGSFFLVLYEGQKVDLLQNITITYGIDVLTTLFLNSTYVRIFKEFNAQRPVSHLRIDKSKEFIMIRKSNFKETISTAFYNCSTIEQNISMMTYEIENLIAIIEEYDNCNE